MTGTLSVVSTPIGNLSDLSFRAVEVLKAADLIACEDTRHTSILTRHYGISAPLASYFEHNKLRRGPELIRALKEGKSVALVCDAGTPGLSDPGSHLIRLAIEEGIPVTAVPGPAAFLAALVLSGKSLDRFFYQGFLPIKPGPRRRRLKELAELGCTVVFYESPYRILKTLEDLVEVLPDRPIAICRELTKKFEEVRRGSAAELLEHFRREAPRGEFVVVF